MMSIIKGSRLLFTGATWLPRAYWATRTGWFAVICVPSPIVTSTNCRRFSPKLLGLTPLSMVTTVPSRLASTRSTSAVPVFNGTVQ